MAVSTDENPAVDSVLLSGTPFEGLVPGVVIHHMQTATPDFCPSQIGSEVFRKQDAAAMVLFPGSMMASPVLPAEDYTRALIQSLPRTPDNTHKSSKGVFGSPLSPDATKPSLKKSIFRIFKPNSEPKAPTNLTVHKTPLTSYKFGESKSPAVSQGLTPSAQIAPSSASSSPITQDSNLTAHAGGHQSDESNSPVLSLNPTPSIQIASSRECPPSLAQDTNSIPQAGHPVPTPSIQIASSSENSPPPTQDSNLTPPLGLQGRIPFTQNAPIKAMSPPLAQGSNLSAQPGSHRLLTSPSSSSKRNAFPLGIFPQNLPKPTIAAMRPSNRGQFDTTMQLVYCSNLSLKAASALHQTSNAPTSNTQDTTLNNRTLDSVKIHEQDSIEQYHLRWLVKKLIEEFAKDKFNEPATLSEIIVLIPVLDYDNYRSLLTCFVTKFQHTPLLDVSLLQGLMQLVENAPLGYLEDDDLIKILDILRPRLEDTHQSSSEYLYQITLAICRLLDVMVNGTVKDVNRTKEHAPLIKVLDGLKDTCDPVSRFHVTYALQALQYVPDDESTLQAVLRFAGGVTMATLGVASICKLDPTNLFDSLEKLQQAAGASCEVAKSIIEGMEANQRGRFGTMQSLLKGVREGTKHEWYLILLAAKSFVQDGRFADFNRTVSEAPCCDKRPFQWGVCQILGEIAMNPLWDPLTRQQAVDFLGTLHRNAGGWKQYPDVKQWIVTILKQLNKSSEDTLMDHARLTLQDLEVDDASTSSPAAAEATPYQLMSRLPLPEYSPLLDRVRKIPYVEPDLLRLKDNILQERCSDIYIPPQAKASLQSQDDDLFPLEKKIHEFLASDRAKVLLLLGDSGAGKSTFSQHLEHHLWSNYQQGGIVPLRILLSAINQPDQDMIKKHLKSNDFTTEQIMELKLARVFVLICDGYDESRQLCNLYHTNRLNRRGQWRCKVIITCRSQYLGHDYRMLFQPTSTTNYLDAPPGSFEEAVIAPFSTDQIKDYVKQYVDLQPRQWSASEYMDKLANIRDLMDLVKNPFLLTLSLQALPAIVGHKTDLSSIRVTRVILYDRFMESWLQYNKQRLQDHRHKFSEAEQKEFQIMLDGNFTQEGTVFLKKLSVCVFDKQPGNPVIIYPAITPRWENGVGAATDDTWKEEFFGSSARIKLLREASPLTRSGKQFRLLHRSLLEYFYSLHFYDPCDFVDMPQDDPPTFESMLLSIFTHSLSQRNIIEEPMVVQFLADRARVDPFFEQQLKIMIGRLTTEPGSSQAKKNAVTIFVEAGIRYRGLDLKEMSVQQRLELFGV